MSRRLAWLCTIAFPTSLLAVASVAPPAAPPAASAPSATRPDSSSQVQARLQPILDAFRARAGFPAGGVAFVLKDGSVGAIVTGNADVENNVALRIDHRLPAGSI